MTPFLVEEINRLSGRISCVVPSTFCVVLFARAVARLPQELRDALVSCELDDAGVLPLS